MEKQTGWSGVQLMIFVKKVLLRAKFKKLAGRVMIYIFKTQKIV
jgi:hypothetical protein